MTLRKLLLFSVCLFPISVWSNPQFGTQTLSNGQKATFVQDQVLVCYRLGSVEAGRRRVSRLYGAQIAQQMDNLRIDLVKVPSGETVESFSQRLRSDPDVDFVQPNYVYSINLTPNDPEFTNQYYLQSNRIQMEAAWDINTGNSSVVVAVIDTGVALTHADLDGTLWVNPNPSGNSGLNGTRIQIDWNLDGDCLDTAEQCASNDPTDDNDPLISGDSNDDFHGTHIAGIIAAETNQPVPNNRDIAGIAFGTRVMAVKSFNSGGDATTASIVEGIQFSIDNGADVLNLSFGSAAADPALEAVLNVAMNQGIIAVAAAGNSNSPPCGVVFPAAYERVIAVSATNEGDTLASFSCSGPELDLAAPGDNILSTKGSPMGSPTGTSSVRGTSFAPPMVAAVAALILSINPNLSVEQVTQYLNYNTDDLDPPGFDFSFGFGRLNAFKTLQAVQNGTTYVSNPVEPGSTFPYPNPYNPTSGIDLTIAIPNGFGRAGLQIQIFNIAGDHIKTLTDTNQWDGRNDSGNFVASGLYYYQAKTDGGDITGKLTILK